MNQSETWLPIYPREKANEWLLQKQDFYIVLQERKNQASFQRNGSDVVLKCLLTF